MLEASRAPYIGNREVALDTTGLPLALLATALLFGGLLAERILIGVRHRGYLGLGLPIGPELVPIERLPKKESGETASVHWVLDGTTVYFWAGRAPTGLHGRISLVGPPGRVALDVRWAPPWSPLFAALWLIGLGLVRGDGWLTVPVGSMMGVGLLFVYWQAAVTAARELRWALVKGDD